LGHITPAFRGLSPILLRFASRGAGEGDILKTFRLLPFEEWEKVADRPDVGNPFVKSPARIYFKVMKKSLGILAVIVVGAVGGLYLAADIPLATNIDASVPPENIVSDAIARRVTAQGVDVDVSDIAKKYIAVGDNRDAVMRYLKAMSFEMFIYDQKVDGKDVVIATRYPMERRLGHYYNPLPIFTDALRVWVHFDGQAVVSVAGRIAFRAL
jgi:hypothetical protein